MPKSSLFAVLLLGCSPDEHSLEGDGLYGVFYRREVALTSTQGALSLRTVRFGRDRVAGSSPREEGGRVQYESGGLIEWWEVHPGGLEQGFRAEHPPDEGPLEIEIAVEGAAPSLRGDGALQLSALRVDGLAAWDATGRPLQARFLESERGFVIRVDDLRAVYPIDIDPVYTLAATTLDGESLDSWFGASVASAGDVNGDGYGDVLVGAWGYASNTGRAYLMLGSSSGLDSTPAATWTGSASGDFLGVSVAGAGDINGDGFDDLLIGAYGTDGNTGTLQVYYGSAAGPAATPDLTLLGEQAGSFFGVDAAAAGDVNGDGYGDIVVSAHGYDLLTGRAYIYLGSASGLASSPAASMDGEAQGDYFGVSVAGAGDVDNDGYDDVIVGAYYYDNYTGRAYVYPGSAGGALTTASAVLTGNPGAHFGVSVAGAGDIDGDGYDDVVIGERNYGGYTGRAYTFRGGAPGLTTVPTDIIDGPAPDVRLGSAVAGAGDVNADGYADVIVGSDGAFGGQGRAYVFEGSPSGLSSSPTALDGESLGDTFGYAVSAAGDVDNDGYDDVIVGAPLHLDIGRAYLHRGIPAELDFDGDGFDAEEDCNDGDAAVHPGAQEICDPSDIDEDCDELADDDDPSVAGQVAWFNDGDSDGHGGSDTTLACDLPPGATAQQTDCDDDEPYIHPDAQEICNEIDDDCDDTVDIGAVDAETWYADQDDDGYTNPSDEAPGCLPPEGYAPASELPDCDDSDNSVHPNAEEVPGDGIDQDCIPGDGPEQPTETPAASEDVSKYISGGCGCDTSARPTPAPLLLALALVGRRFARSRRDTLRGGGWRWLGLRSSS